MQARRARAARRFQAMQIQLHERLLAKVLAGRGARVLRVVRFFFQHVGVLRGAMARMLGVGQLEHVETVAASPRARPPDPAGLRGDRADLS